MAKFMEKHFTKLINTLIFLLIVNLFIYIFFGSKALMNSDSAFIVDYSLEQIRTHSFFPKNWVNTNDFWVYSLIPLITIFLKLGLNLFLSRQLSVFIQTCLIFLILYDLFKKQLKDKTGFKIILLLFLSGISGQFIFEVYGDATYGSIIFYMILELWLFIKYLNDKKIINLILLFAILMLITACSIRFPIYIGAPLICCLLYFIYDKGFKKEYIKTFISIVLAIGVGFLLNKYLSNVLTISTATSKELLSDSSLFNKSIDDTLFNYFWLCGATGLNVFSLTAFYKTDLITSSSPFVIVSFIKFIYAIVTLLLPIILLKKFNKMKKSEKILFIFSSSLLIIILFFLIICGMSSWYRYITPVLFFLNMLYPLCYKYYFSNVKKNRIVFGIFIISCVGASLFLNITSYYDLKKLSIKENNYQNIANYLVKKNLKYGYVYNGQEHNVYNLITNGKLRITRITSDGKEPYYWLNSKDWFKKEYYNGKVFFMRGEYDKSLEFEKLATNSYKYDGYVIFVFDNNSIILDSLHVN